VSSGETICLREEPDARPQLVRLYLLGSAWGALLHQRGELALHAGVTAQPDGDALVFCGPQGAGKSSLVAALLRRGHLLVSDDLTRLEIPPNGPPQVWPALPRLKLSGDALVRSGFDPGGLEPDGTLPKLQLPWDEGVVDGPRPLRRVYILAWGELRLRRLTGVAALRELARGCLYRPQLLASAAEQAAHWQLCEEIAQRVEVWELSRPQDWEALEQVMERLEATLSI
jgi:hypothetical protein